MSDNVVPLHGSDRLLTAPGEPIPKLIEELEWALKEAKSGNMQGLAMSYVICDGTACPMTECLYVHARGTARLLDSAIHLLQRKFGRYIDAED